MQNETRDLAYDQAFQTARLPPLTFGSGSLSEVATIAARFGRSALLVTGQRSFQSAQPLLQDLDRAGVSYTHVVISGEPSPDQVDRAVTRNPDAEMVIAIGGGAAVDAGKAISAMLPLQAPVKRYLEGVGDREPPGLKVPYIACPTTAGTGAEVTKNAVITEVGHEGFKKSLRHDAYIPDAIVIDPALAVSCPANVTAACGMDALTQLLEAFVSTAASPFTDSFARSGLTAVTRSLKRAYESPRDVDARSDMAWGAYASGVALAHAGLGVVHGLASPVGSFYPIPHGVVCGALLPAATSVNVRWLIDHDPEGVALQKHAEVAQLFGHHGLSVAEASLALVESLERLRSELKIPLLSDWSVSVEDRIVSRAGLKNNPARLTRDDIAELLREAGLT